MDETTGSGGVVPLKGMSPEGEPYVRPVRVEAEIERIVDLPLNNAFSLAATDALLPQTVMHLLRNFPNNRSPLYCAAFERFLARAERTADRLLAYLPVHWRERGRDMAIDEILQRFGTDRLDIFELSYKTAMERICVDVGRKLRLRIRTELPAEDLADRDGEQTGGDAVDAMVFRVGATMPAAEAVAQLRSALAVLTDRERWVLLAVEFADMTEDEVGTEIGCGARNVRHILKRAREKVRAGGITQ